ncbi:MAG TPA: hypothetical protein VN716_19640 [Vicinamibacterales bacterium]|nr:hypothetical protein [Vicinamibacterales bacterium]
MAMVNVPSPATLAPPAPRNDAKFTPRMSSLRVTRENGRRCESNAVPVIFAARPGISERSMPDTC